MGRAERDRISRRGENDKEDRMSGAMKERYVHREGREGDLESIRQQFIHLGNLA